MVESIDEIQKIFDTFQKRLVAVETNVKDSDPEPADPTKKSFWIYLFGIFIVSVGVLKACKTDRSQMVYLIISVIMRVALILQLPNIINAFTGM